MKIKNMLYAAMFAAIVAVLGLMPPIPLLSLIYGTAIMLEKM